MKLKSIFILLTAIITTSPFWYVVIRNVLAEMATAINVLAPLWLLLIAGFCIYNLGKLAIGRLPTSIGYVCSIMFRRKPKQHLKVVQFKPQSSVSADDAWLDIPTYVRKYQRETLSPSTASLD